MTKLYVMNGPSKDEAFELAQNITYLGRGPDNDIQIKDKSVSRKHLRIRRMSENGPFLIKDLSSTNGTFVQGKRIDPASEFEVKEGVPVAMGNVFFSLGRPSTEDLFAVQDVMDPAGEMSETGIFDRPMTSPKNLELIYKVANALMESLDLNRLLEQVLEYIFELLKRIDRGAIILIDPETHKVKEVITKSSDGNEKTTMLYSRSIVSRVLQKGKPIVMTDTLGQDKRDRSESMELMKIRSVMCVPLISKSRIRGVIYVDSLNKPYGFRKEDLSLISALSSTAAIAIENALLYSDLESLVDERTRSLKKTEERLRESEARYKAILDNMSSGVVVYEPVDEGKDFLVLDLNRADQKIEKVHKKEAIGKSLFDVFPRVKETGLVEAFRKVLKTGRPEQISATLSDGGEIKAWRDYYVCRLPTGEIVTIFDDVTEKMKAEEEQRALQRQLIVSQRMESIGAFAGGTAHNFRNILQAISGNIEYLEMIHGENPEVKELAKSIYDSVEKGVDLINNLLHFSRRGEGYEFVALDLGGVIMKAYEIIEKVFNKNIEIKLKLAEGLFVRGNQALLSQVFMNLFTNARDAMPEGGKLVIEAKRLDDRVVAMFADTGHGMDKDTLEKIFDPFFTLKDVGKGTGLGMSTSHGIIEEHNGTIIVSSKPGKGSVFRIYLPAVEAEISRELESQKKIVYGRGQKILIVDDETPALEALTNLTNILGYRTIPVDRPSDALKNYGEYAPDVVLMDRNMPQMDGITCIREIRKSDPEARIVIVSGYDETGADGIDEDIREFIKGYLTKPCGVEALSQAISQALKV